MPERTTVRMPDDLLRRAKRKAAAERRTLKALIEEGLRRMLDDPAPDGQSEREALPVSAAAGGLAPGADIDNSAALQEMDDLEFAKRLGMVLPKSTQ